MGPHFDRFTVGSDGRFVEDLANVHNAYCSSMMSGRQRFPVLNVAGPQLCFFLSSVIDAFVYVGYVRLQPCALVRFTLQPKNGFLELTPDVSFHRFLLSPQLSIEEFLMNPHKDYGNYHALMTNTLCTEFGLTSRARVDDFIQRFVPTFKLVRRRNDFGVDYVPRAKAIPGERQATCAQQKDSSRTGTGAHRFSPL